MRSSNKYGCNSDPGGKRSFAFLAVGVVMLIGGTGAIADSGADDAYLNSLEEEVSSLGASAKKSEKAPEVENLAVKSFERKLHTKNAGSYQFYMKLDEEDKLTAYKEYEKTKDLSAASDKIFDLFFHVARRNK